MNDELPDRPVELWANERESPWSILALPFFPAISPGSVRGVASVSANGLTLRSVKQIADPRAPGGPARPKRMLDPIFTPWSEIDRIEPGSATALARVALSDGTMIELGPEHLPRSADEAERQRRLRVLQRALELGKIKPAPTSGRTVSGP